MFDQEIARLIKNNTKIDREFLKWAIGEFMRTNQADEPGCEEYYTIEQLNKILPQIVHEVDEDLTLWEGY